MNGTNRFRSLASRGLWRCLNGITPIRHQLRLRYAANVIGGPEPELKYLRQLGPNAGTALDVGANEGLFSFRLAQLYDCVHAFEINSAITHRLRSYKHPKIKIHDIGLSDRSGTATLFLPVYRGQELNGWGSLRRENCPNAESLIEKEVQVRPLDDFQLENVRFIKADIEGHEFSFLQGAAKTLKRCRPNVLIEIKENNLQAIRSFFKELDYEEHRLETFIGIAGSEENFLFVAR